MYVFGFGRVKCIHEYWIHQLDDVLGCRTPQMKDGALVMDAVAQLPENAIFKYRLKTFDLKQLQGAAVQDG